jgi:hypothetical protein
MRLWTFGCSMTEYPWPTWADILVEYCKKENIQAENWGMCGSGNQAIVTKILECHAKNNLGPNDYVLVCFTSFFRNDYYVEEKGWYLPSRLQDNIIKHHRLKNKELHISPVHYVMRDCASIASVKLALNQLGVNFMFWFWNDQHVPDQNLAKLPVLNFDKVLSTYDELIKTDIPDLQGVIYRPFKFNSFFRGNGCPPEPEIHPTPLEHYAYLKNNIVDKLEWIDKNKFNDIEVFVNYWQRKIESYEGTIDLEGLGWKVDRNINWW